MLKMQQKPLLLSGIIMAILWGFTPYPKNDSFWHIKTGEYIYQNFKIPTHDVFSWYGLENGLSWINHEWLYDLIVYLVYQQGGLLSVSIFTALCSGLLFYLIFTFTQIRSQNFIISLIIAFIGIMGMDAWLSARPQTISYCLLLLLAILLEKKKWPWAVPITIIGTNIHGGFYPMYILLTAYYAYKEKPGIILLTFLSVLINPYWGEMITYPFEIQKYSYFYTYIEEWQRTKLASPDNRFHLIIYFSLLLLIFGQKLSLRDTAISLFLVLQTLSAIRHIVFLYLLILPILSPYLLNGALKGVGLLKERFKLGESFNKKLKATSILLVLFLLSLSVWSVYTVNQVKIADEYPEKAVAFIKQHQLPRLFNVYGDGGYLILNGVQPLIDGRADIFVPLYNNTNLFLDYCQTYTLDKDYMEFINSYSIQSLLLKKESRLYFALKHNEKFSLIYEDDHYVILSFQDRRS